MKYGKSIIVDGSYSTKKHIVEHMREIDGVAVCGKEVPKMTMTVKAKPEELCRFCLHWYKKKYGMEYKID